MITIKEIRALSLRAKAVVAQARGSMLEPEEAKISPVFTINDIASATGLNPPRIRALMREAREKDVNLPLGSTKDQLPENQRYGLDGRGQQRFYTGDEFHRICKYLAPSKYRPETAPAAIITVCNYKGGVSKSTSVACIAHTLSMQGHAKVLVLDMDPQGSATNLFGYLQTFDVDATDTALPVLEGKAKSLRKMIRKTYWPGIDIIPSCPALQIAEANFRRDIEAYGIEVMANLHHAFNEIRYEYDFIIIDTPPSLNNLTLHALMNSTGVVMPLPPSSLDLSSASMFWDLFLGYMETRNVPEDVPIFQFLRVFSPKMEKNKSCRNVRHWIDMTYDKYFVDVYIPKAAAVSRASDAFGTVFDRQTEAVNKGSGYEAVRAGYIELSEELAEEARKFWKEHTA